MKKNYKKEAFYILVLGILVLISIIPLLRHGFYSFHDEPNVAHFHQMIRSISEGNIPPRWIPDVTYNYGSPYFNYFYHWPFYVGTVYYFLGFGLLASFKLVMITTVILSAVFFYILIRKFFEPPAALGATTLYIFTPYRAVDLYVRGAFGELWGFVFMPLILLALILLIEKSTIKRLFLASCSIAFLIISHNSSAMMFLPVAFVFGLVYSWVSNNKKVTKKIGFVMLAFLGGLGLSCYYWLPAVIESSYIKPGSPFSLVDHFPFISQLLLPSWGYGASLWGPDDGMSFQIGVINFVVVALAGVVFYFYRTNWTKGKKVLLLFSLTAFLGAVVFMNIRTYFLWELFPLSDYIQFPWRLLLMTTFFSAILSAFIFDHIRNRSSMLFWISLAMVVLFNVAYFNPEKYINTDENYYLKKYFANIDTNGRSNQFSDEYLNNSEDYLPTMLWSDVKPVKVPQEKITTADGDLSFVEISSTKYSAMVESTDGTNLVLHSFYFPGWTAYIDGQKTLVTPNNPVGDISLKVPSGSHKIEIVFEDTPLRKLANFISLFSFIAFGIAYYADKKHLLKTLIK